MNNLGTFTLILAGKIFLVVIWVFVLVPLSKRSRCIKKRSNRLANKMFWNSWIVAILESFVIVCLCAFISLKFNLSFSSSGQSTQTIACLIITFIYIAVPTFALRAVIKDFNKIGTKAMKEKFGALYEGRAVQRGKKVLL